MIYLLVHAYLPQAGRQDYLPAACACMCVRKIKTKCLSAALLDAISKETGDPQKRFWLADHAKTSKAFASSRQIYLAFSPIIRTICFAESLLQVTRMKESGCEKAEVEKAKIANYIQLHVSVPWTTQIY
jgi:hypothetical protein